jgi:hypothetical protein
MIFAMAKLKIHLVGTLLYNTTYQKVQAIA